MAKVTLTQQVEALTAIVAALANNAQHSTPAAVVEAVKPAAAPAVESASDKLKAHVESKGLAFARGGRTVLSTEALTAAVRVLKTGTPEILPVTESLNKRGVVGLAIGRDGKNVITQYLFDPKA